MKTSGKHILGYGGLTEKRWYLFQVLNVVHLVSYTADVNVRVSEGCEDVSPNVWLRRSVKVRLLCRRDRGVECDTVCGSGEGNDAHKYLLAASLGYEQILRRATETCVEFGRLMSSKLVSD